MSQARIHNHKRLLIILGVILLVAAGVAVYFLLAHPGSKPTSSSPSSAAAQKTAAAQDKVIFQTQQAATDKLQTGDVTGALATYDTAIAQSSDNVVKSDLYAKKSVVAANNNQLDVALQAALAAVKADANGGTLSNLAYVYELKGDNANASKYYTEAADYIEKDPNSVSTTSSNSYRQKAQELQGK